MPKSKTKLSPVGAAEMAEAVDALVKDKIDLLMNNRRLVLRSLVKGFFAGLGGVIGATVGVGILLGVLQQFGGLPLVGDFFKGISTEIQEPMVRPPQ